MTSSPTALPGSARLPIVPVLKPDVKFQPVYVVDLARAIARAVLEPATHGGKTYEIGGPQVFSMIELHRAIYAASGQSPNLVELPDFAGDLLSRLGFLPGAPITRDQWMMLGRDNVVANGGKGLGEFGIEPTPLAAVAGEWLGAVPRQPLRRSRHGPGFALNADPLARHHPRHRRGCHRISARLLDRPFDPCDRASGLRRRRPGRCSTSPSSRARSSPWSLIYWRTFWDVLVGLFNRSRDAWAFVRNILAAFLPAVVIGLAIGDHIELLLANAVIVAWALDHRRHRHPRSREGRQAQGDRRRLDT